MPSVDREASRDSIEERNLIHRNSTSFDHGRALTIPMWDSSDPERAPPPLPLNPSSPKVTSRPNTSRAIQSAHAALTERARESAYITNPLPKRIEASPERPSSKGSGHKRVQSTVKDLSNLIEGGTLLSSSPRPEKYTSPEKNSSPERSYSPDKYSRPSTPRFNKEFLLEAPPEKNTSRQSTPVPSNKEKDSESPPSAPMPTLRPSLRRPHQQSILGENTPPQSATMLALQSTPSKDVDNPLSNVTNGSTALARTGNYDISYQILSLTNICTSLQKEMSNLSRRSKDNATDLVSLKEATNSRDEDIRKSLRELVSNLSDTSSRGSSIQGMGPLYLDNKPHGSSPSSKAKHFSLPRIPSPASFSASLDRGMTQTPPVFGPESAASIALLEKILREMGTKEGQDLLVSRLSEVADRLARDGMSTSKKLEDLVQFIKENTESQALIARSNGNGNGTSRGRKYSFCEAPRLELDFDPVPGPLATRNRDKEIEVSAARAADIVNGELLKVIRSVKDSVAHGGGVTAEVKALVRELRGEVLGMGRELGRKLDEIESKKGDLASSASQNNEEINRIVQSGLEELKVHLDQVMRENRRQSVSSQVSRNTVDGEEIFKAVKNAMAEFQAVQNASTEPQTPGLEKEDVIEAVRVAWEHYKPDIELQHFGLERDELLACLKEGIQEFMPRDDNQGATREEVFKAVVEGMKHFVPPKVETEASLSKEEILDAVRDCLEEFEFPSAPPVPREDEITRDDVVAAVREGLSTFDFPAPDNSQALANPVIQRDDIFEAVKAGLSDLPGMTAGVEERISDRLREILDSIRVEFQAVSEEAKQNVAAHGRDTEQLLDANRDGLEKLRSDIESYVDRAADVTGKDEILESLRLSFTSLSEQVEVLISRGPESSVDALKAEFEHLQHTMAMSLVRGSPSADKDEIIEAVREGIDGLRADIERPRDSNESVLSGTGEILDALHDGLAELRSDVEKIAIIANKPVEPIDMTLHYEILDTLKAGLESLRADMDRLKEAKSDNEDRSVAAITEGAVVAATAESLKRNDIENLEVLITQLRIKVEALEAMPQPQHAQPSLSLAREDLAQLEQLIQNVHASVIDIQERERAIDEDTIKKDDVVAIETLLRNTKAKIDDIDPEQAVKKDHLDAVEAVLRETHAGVSELVSQVEDVSRKEDIGRIESLVKEVFGGLQELKEKIAEEANNGEKLSKTDVEAVEALVLDVKTQIDQMVLTDLATLATKDELKNLEELVKEFKERIDTHAETNVKAFEERQAETVGVGERVTEVQSFLKEFHGALHEKLDEGATSVEALGKFLEGIGETISHNARMTDDIKELHEAVQAEFEKSNAGVVGAKIESDEKFEQTWAKIDEKFQEKFAELAAKHEETQVAAAEKSAGTEAAVLGTKAVAEDLKLFIDSLGATLAESVEKMDEASKTVFLRVEDTFTKVGEIFDQNDETFNKVAEIRNEARAEHALTREEVSKTLTTVEGVSGNVNEYNPKILDSIKDVLQIVGQHYEHSKSATNAISLKIDEIPPPPEPPLLPEPPKVEKYDDTEVHEKLNKLVEHVQTSTTAFAQLEMLDQIHQKVMSTAAEVSTFVATQTKLITEGHEDKQKEVEAATIALEKRMTQRDHVEAQVVGLREEEDRLRESVQALRNEEAGLMQRKLSLTATVSSLETALSIRREELQGMEVRAEGLERRILESIIDHSRALLLSKQNKPATKDSMNMKRVPSHSSAQNGRSTSHATSFGGSEFSGASNSNKSAYSSISQSAVTLAMNSNIRSLNPSNNSTNLTVPSHNPANTSRRILSLSQITNNALNNINSTAPGFKRSHSVRAPPGASGGLRKSSWNGVGGKRVMSAAGLELNKENLAAVNGAHDEHGIGSGGEDENEETSDAGTTRRLSTGVIEEGDEDEDTDDDEGTNSMSSDDGDVGSVSMQGEVDYHGGEMTLYGREGGDD